MPARSPIRTVVLSLVMALAVWGQSLAQSDDSFCQRALAAYEEGATSAGAAYNAACCLSLAGSIDEAFATLDEALERGYRDVDWMNEDVDLLALHDDERWLVVLERCLAARESYVVSIHRELYEMFQADQSDRRGAIDWSVAGPRDEARRLRALELVAADALRAPDDFVHASFIFQHGHDSDDYKLAHELAMQAVALDSTHARARWIAAATKDRYLQSLGEPQIYGTQRRLVDGAWTLEPLDPDAVSDAERAWWGVPPLERSRERVREMNEG